MEVVKIVIVEDDVYQNKALTKYVQTICGSGRFPNISFSIKSYTNAHECIEEMDDDTGILLLDYYLINLEETDVLTGGDVVDMVNKFCPDCEIVLISSQEDPQITDELRAKGITEYVDKNLNSINRIGAVLQEIISNKSSISK
ncbi:MAG: response regulator of citrate/malate metabolism [Bacteroidia bacterium]|jgi:response regulator of citrate/malate metabolism